MAELPPFSARTTGQAVKVFHDTVSREFILKLITVKGYIEGIESKARLQVFSRKCLLTIVPCNVKNFFCLFLVQSQHAVGILFISFQIHNQFSRC